MSYSEAEEWEESDNGEEEPSDGETLGSEDTYSDDCEEYYLSEKEEDSICTQLNNELDEIEASRLAEDEEISSSEVRDKVIEIEVLEEAEELEAEDPLGFQEVPDDVKGRKVRAKHWIITINNYTKEDEDKFRTLFKENMLTYFIFGREIGAKGTPHLQCYIACKKQEYRTTVSNWWPRAFIGFMKTPDPKRASDYCKKGDQPKREWIKYKKAPWKDPTQGPHYGKNEDGTLFTDFVEDGILSEKGNEKGGAATQKKYQILNGMVLQKNKTEKQVRDEIRDEMPEIYYRIRKSVTDEIRDSRLPVDPKDLPGVCGIWITGKAGLGKSWLARKNICKGVHYRKPLGTNLQWWNGYTNQEFVWVDDYSYKYDDHLHSSALKEWADETPLNVAGKGYMMCIRPRWIVVTSQYTIESIFQEKKEEEYDAIKRRFKQIHLKENWKFTEARLKKYNLYDDFIAAILSYPETEQDVERLERGIQNIIDQSFSQQNLSKISFQQKMTEVELLKNQRNQVISQEKLITYIDDAFDDFVNNDFDKAPDDTLKAFHKVDNQSFIQDIQNENVISLPPLDNLKAKAGGSINKNIIPLPPLVGSSKAKAAKAGGTITNQNESIHETNNPKKKSKVNTRDRQEFSIDDSTNVKYSRKICRYCHQIDTQCQCRDINKINKNNNNGSSPPYKKSKGPVHSHWVSQLDHRSDHSNYWKDLG